MAAAWHGGISASGNSNAGVYVKNATTLDAISRGMDYWFNNLYNLTDCIDLGGLPQCPCDTPGFWNTNVGDGLFSHLSLTHRWSTFTVVFQRKIYFYPICWHALISTVDLGPQTGW